jgi:hypothetical protein
MDFVHDDALRSFAEEVVSVPIALDIIEADDDERVILEEVFSRREIALDLGCAGSGDAFGPDVELLEEFPVPLFDEVGRAEHGQTADLAAVDELPRDHAGLDRLTHAHVVGDQEANDVLLHGHQQGHQLVDLGLDRDIAEGAERPGTRTKFELQGITQETSAIVRAGLGGIRGIEISRTNLAERNLESRAQQHLVGLGPAEGPQDQAGLGGLRLNDPIAPTRGHDRSGAGYLRHFDE